MDAVNYRTIDVPRGYNTENRRMLGELVSGLVFLGMSYSFVRPTVLTHFSEWRCFVSFWTLPCVYAWWSFSVLLRKESVGEGKHFLWNSDRNNPVVLVRKLVESFYSFSLIALLILLNAHDGETFVFGSNGFLWWLVAFFFFTLFHLIYMVFPYLEPYLEQGADNMDKRFERQLLDSNDEWTVVDEDERES